MNFFWVVNIGSMFYFTKPKEKGSTCLKHGEEFSLESYMTPQVNAKVWNGGSQLHPVQAAKPWNDLTASSPPWKIKNLFPFFLLLITTTYLCSSGQEEHKGGVIATPACLGLLKGWLLVSFNHEQKCDFSRQVCDTHTTVSPFSYTATTFCFLLKENSLRMMCSKESHPFKSPSKYRKWWNGKSRSWRNLLNLFREQLNRK